MRTALLVIIAALGTANPGWAQTIGPGGGLIAPGPDQPPGYTPGGIGPGGGMVAPGPAARDVPIQQYGFGHTLLAPGSTGNLNTGPAVRTPRLARASRNFAVAMKAGRRGAHGQKRTRRVP
jgi:hypothetical protein